MLDSKIKMQGVGLMIHSFTPSGFLPDEKKHLKSFLPKLPETETKRDSTIVRVSA